MRISAVTAAKGGLEPWSSIFKSWSTERSLRESAKGASKVTFRNRNSCAAVFLHMKLDFNGFVNKLRVFVTVDHDRCRPIETCGLTALMVPRSLGVFFFLGRVINRIRSTTYSKKISKNLHI